MDCVFCNIENEKNRILSRNKYFYVMLSNPRLMAGHILIIPYRHVTKLSELNSDEKAELIDLTISYQEKMLKHCTGTTIRQNYMPFLKDSKLKVAHLHIHITPRYLEDELYQKVLIHETDAFTDLNDDESSEWIKKLA